MLKTKFCVHVQILTFIKTVLVHEGLKRCVSDKLMFICYFTCYSFIYLFVVDDREKRLREEIEKYRQERPKIQQQFSDLKVNVILDH